MHAARVKYVASKLEPAVDLRHILADARTEGNAGKKSKALSSLENQPAPAQAAAKFRCDGIDGFGAGQQHARLVELEDYYFAAGCARDALGKLVRGIAEDRHAAGEGARQIKRHHRLSKGRT